MATETEVKIRLTQDAASARTLIEQAGFKARGPRILEADQLYDLPGMELRQSGRVLRLRTRGSECILTYKGPTYQGQGAPERHKSREEIETAIPDSVTFTAILYGLGFNPTFRYEKYRTTFAGVGEPGVITLDETPIGLFLEIEGPAEWIDLAASRLGYTPRDYLTSSYSSLFREFRASNPDIPDDMVF